MVENKEYTGGAPSVPSDNGGITPYPVVTPPISKDFDNEPVTPTPKVLFTANCAGAASFQFTGIKVLQGTVTFTLYINGALANSKDVYKNVNGVDFTMTGSTGTNVCMVSGPDNTTFSGKVDQI